MFARDVWAGQTRNWTLKAALLNKVWDKIKLYRKIQTLEKQADKKTGRIGQKTGWSTGVRDEGTGECDPRRSGLTFTKKKSDAGQPDTELKQRVCVRNVEDYIG